MRISRLARRLRHTVQKMSRVARVRCSRACHTARLNNRLEELSDFEAKLDQSARQIWQLTDSELRACNEALAEFGFTTSRADLDEDAGNEDATNSTLGYRQDQPWGGDELRRELCNRDPDIASRFAARPARPASAHARSGTDWRSARTLVLARADQCRRPDASRKCLAEAQQIIETTDERYSEAEVYRLRDDLLSRS